MSRVVPRLVPNIERAIMKRTAPSSLAARVKRLANHQPSSWATIGRGARPNLHGLLRYPAMMIPSMQGDILDAVLAEIDGPCRVTDPFVGSGTVMTEALIRGLDFVGIDINPLAALVCEAKIAVDAGADVENGVEVVLHHLARDVKMTIDVDFAGRAKWFSRDSAIYFSKIRRAIMHAEDVGTRKVLWVAFADTIRRCSNSRTSTYKLHVRPDAEMVDVSRVREVFFLALREVLQRTSDYQQILAQSRSKTPKARIICGDVRTAKIPTSRTRHQILVTSPPYGDNVTTIPYGQFSFLALNWIDPKDLPDGVDNALLANTHALDAASLGGSVLDAQEKHAEMVEVSPTYKRFSRQAKRDNRDVRKVSCFMYDYWEALHRVNSKALGSAHWVMTTGNRNAAGLKVPFDAINRDIVEALGGRCVTSIQRKLPVKRMPNRNSIGELINTETTLVAEFA